METGKLVKFEGMPVQGNFTQEQIMEVLQKLACNPGLLERMINCADRFSASSRRSRPRLEASCSAGRGPG